MTVWLQFIICFLFVCFLWRFRGLLFGGPPKPPTPFVTEVFDMSDKVAFTVLFPAVPAAGSPVVRMLEFFVKEEKVQTGELPLEECVVRFVIPYETEAEIYTRTADKAGNWSEPSFLFISGLKDMTPPPAPPAPVLTAGTMEEVSEEVGFTIVPPATPDEPEEEPKGEPKEDTPEEENASESGDDETGEEEDTDLEVDEEEAE